MADQANQASGSSVKRKAKQYGKYCVAGGPNNESCKNSSSTPDISMHEFPKERSLLRKQWTQFVQKRRRDWQPSPYSCLCSAHFEPTCFTQRLDLGIESKTKRLLDRSCAVPTIDTASSERTSTVVSPRERRLVSLHYNYKCTYVFDSRVHRFIPVLILLGRMFNFFRSFAKLSSQRKSYRAILWKKKCQCQYQRRQHQLGVRYLLPNQTLQKKTSAKSYGTI